MKSKLCAFSALIACLLLVTSASFTARASSPLVVPVVSAHVDLAVMDPPSTLELCWNALQDALEWCDRANQQRVGACQIAWGDGHHPTELHHCLLEAEAEHALCVGDVNDLYLECISESKIDHPVAVSTDDPWAVVLKTVTTFNPGSKFHLN